MLLSSCLTASTVSRSLRFLQGRFLQLLVLLDATHNASYKAGRPSALPQCYTQRLIQDREAFSSSSVLHTMPHTRQGGLQLFLSATHNASYKTGRPSALPQCYTQRLIQDREAFSSSSVLHTTPHTRQGGLQLFLSATHNASYKTGRPSALPQCYTQRLIQDREAFSSSSVLHTTPHPRQGGLQLFLSATHNASYKTGRPSALPQCYTQRLIQGREAFSSSSVLHTTPHTRQGGLQLFLSATHNASYKAGRPSALPQCYTQRLIQGREAFSSSSVLHTTPHARLIPFVFTIYHTHFFIMQGRFL